MSFISTSFIQPFPAYAWQPDALALLDEQHVAAFSGSERRRNAFTASLQQFIGSQRDTDCCVLYGQFIHDLDTFCHQLERILPGPRLARRIDGPDGITDLLRSRQTFLGRPATRSRYFVWTDADAMIARDPVTFSHVLEAFAGVAAEQEYVSDDMLLIQRLLLVGGPRLKLISDDPRGPMHQWLSGGDRPFWKLVTGLEHPPFGSFDIDKVAGL